MIYSFHDLRTWKEGHALAMEVYKITLTFPSSEKFGVISQLRSASLSIPANIAEGSGRGTPKDIVRFLMNSRGSLQEVNYFLLASRDLGYIDSNMYETLTHRYNGLSVGINRQIEGLLNAK